MRALVAGHGKVVVREQPSIHALHHGWIVERLDKLPSPLKRQFTNHATSQLFCH